MLIYYYYSFISVSMSRSTFVGILTFPDFETKYEVLKFHLGSFELLDELLSLIYFQIVDAVVPFTLPNVSSTPTLSKGKFFFRAKEDISWLVPNSWFPNSCEGKAKIVNSLEEYFFPNDSNNLYPRWVAPHCDATLVA